MYVYSSSVAVNITANDNDDSFCRLPLTVQPERATKGRLMMTMKSSIIHKFRRKRSFVPHFYTCKRLTKSARRCQDQRQFLSRLGQCHTSAASLKCNGNSEFRIVMLQNIKMVPCCGDEAFFNPSVENISTCEEGKG